MTRAKGQNDLRRTGFEALLRDFGINPKDLALCLDGISYQAIVKLASGVMNIRQSKYSTLKQIADFLGYSGVDQFMYEIEKREQELDLIPEDKQRKVITIQQVLDEQQKEGRLSRESCDILIQASGLTKPYENCTDNMKLFILKEAASRLHIGGSLVDWLGRIIQ